MISLRCDKGLLLVDKIHYDYMVINEIERCLCNLYWQLISYKTFSHPPVYRTMCLVKFDRQFKVLLLSSFP